MKGRTLFKSIFGDLEQKRLSKVEFFESEEFNRIYLSIYDWVKVHGRIDDTDVNYKLASPGMNIESDDFNKFTECIEETLKGNEVADMTSFKKCHYVYKCFDMYLIHGQGTYCYINYNLSNDRELKLNSIIG